MKTKKIIGTILILIGLFLGFKGYYIIKENKSKVEILDLEMDFSNKGKIETGYFYLGGSALLLVLGTFIASRKD